MRRSGPASVAAVPRARARWGLVTGLVLTIGIGAVNLTLTGRSVAVLGLLATAPLLAASVASVAGSLGAGVLAAGGAVLVGDYDRALWSRDLLVILGGIALATAFATVMAAVKRRRLRQLHDTRTVSEVVQQTLLRPVPSDLGGVRIATRYSSATRGAHVGGDVYDVVSTPYGVRIFMGDVRGKGLPAVHLAGTALGAFREWAYQSGDLSDLAARLDVSVARQAGPEDFVTAVLAQVADGQVDIVNCGHPAPALITREAVSMLHGDGTSLPLGLGVTPVCRRTPFAPGDRLLFYTDGLSDARRRREFLDLPTELAALHDEDADQMVRLLHRRLVKFTRRRLADDVAILLVERCGDRPDTAADGLLDSLASPVTG